MKRALLSLLILLPAAAWAELPPIKPAPTRPPEGPAVVMEEFEVLPDCAAEKVCSEGLIRNIGSRTAHHVRLRIEIGGTKFGKPRTFYYQELDKSELEPTEAQSVSVTIDRKRPYKNAKGEEKVIEVGRYNFKVVPVWKESPLRPARRKR